MSSEQRLQLVWFNRDLRVADHRPLREAAARGPCLCLYVYETDVIAGEDYDACHLRFVNESLADLRGSLRDLGADLVVRTGTLPGVFAELHREHGFGALWRHAETGNDLTYRRDRRVNRWAREAGLPIHSFTQNGVVRRLRSRDGWAGLWQQRMGEPVLRRPERIMPVADVPPGETATAESLGLEPSTKHAAQPGGESIGRETLRTFLNCRGVNYRRDMSSPVTGEDGCSRLSPYIAWGCVSLKHVHQATAQRTQQLRSAKARGERTQPGWLQSLSSFQGRLRWHCHFMQKLEDEPRIEFENMNRAYDGLREAEFNEEHFDAWRRGETGYPMVDACMRSLHQNGWINFRMRAMLVSFASYHLWLHWRRPAVYLARQFVDYEPGIHYSQFQMQSGTTGINSLRIYSPIKQAQDQDPTGEFIRQYVPELADVPLEHLHEPHKLPPLLQQDSGCVIGRDYPAPVVDHATAYNEARRRMMAHRKRDGVRRASQQVFQKHGSRRGPRRRTWRR
ncbi:MAG: deoxyribodipyrimidine photo-lyase/cryptochrome family protein [Planctomycetota bacterium]